MIIPNKNEWFLNIKEDKHYSINNFLYKEEREDHNIQKHLIDITVGRYGSEDSYVSFIRIEESPAGDLCWDVSYIRDLREY